MFPASGTINNILQSVPPNSQSDAQNLTSLNGESQVHYLLVAGANGICFSSGQLGQISSAYLQIVVGGQAPSPVTASASDLGPFNWSPVIIGVSIAAVAVVVSAVI